MEASEILASVRGRGATIWLLEGERLAVAPRYVLDDGLRAALIANKRELVAALEQEYEAIPIIQERTVWRSSSGVEVVEVLLDPPDPTHWEKRLVRGVVALVGEVTTDPGIARLWVKALQSEASDEGAAVTEGLLRRV